MLLRQNLKEQENSKGKGGSNRETPYLDYTDDKRKRHVCGEVSSRKEVRNFYQKKTQRNINLCLTTKGKDFIYQTRNSVKCGHSTPFKSHLETDSLHKSNRTYYNLKA